jgi:hypothetical protein
MEYSFEIITEGDLPNWKVHVCISDSMGESQTYWSSRQSAVEDAVRGAHDLEKGFLNAKQQHPEHELDEQLESSMATGRSPAASRSSRSHRRQEKNDSARSGDDTFNPRAFMGGMSDDPFAASSSSSAAGAAAVADPFGGPTPAPTLAPSTSSTPSSATCWAGTAWPWRREGSWARSPHCGAADQCRALRLSAAGAGHVGPAAVHGERDADQHAAEPHDRGNTL